MPRIRLGKERKEESIRKDKKGEIVAQWLSKVMSSGHSPQKPKIEAMQYSET